MASGAARGGGASGDAIGATATHLKSIGADDRVLATLAGHRDPRSIMKYARLSPTTVANALRRLRERK